MAVHHGGLPRRGPGGGTVTPLTGSATESPWDPELGGAMSAHGLAVEEEAVADLLAGDLVG